MADRFRCLSPGFRLFLLGMMLSSHSWKPRRFMKQYQTSG